MQEIGSVFRDVVLWYIDPIALCYLASTSKTMRSHIEVDTECVEYWKCKLADTLGMSMGDVGVFLTRELYKGLYIDASRDTRLARRMRSHVGSPHEFVGENMYYMCTNGGNVRTVRAILEIKSSRRNPTDGIISAAHQGHHEIVDMILEDGKENPAYRRSEALRLAVLERHTDVVRLLLADGRANPRVYDNSCIIEACTKGYHEIVELLLADGRANPSTRHNQPIREACRLGHTKTVEILLTSPLVNPAVDNNICIRTAIEKGNNEIVKLLLNSNRGCDREDCLKRVRLP